MAEDAHNAIELLGELDEDNIETFVIISDWLMPKMKRDEFLVHAHKHFPSIVKIMLTG